MAMIVLCPSLQKWLKCCMCFRTFQLLHLSLSRSSRIIGHDKWLDDSFWPWNYLFAKLDTTKVRPSSKVACFWMLLHWCSSCLSMQRLLLDGWGAAKLNCQIAPVCNSSMHGGLYSFQLACEPQVQASKTESIPIIFIRLLNCFFILHGHIKYPTCQ